MTTNEKAVIIQELRDRLDHMSDAKLELLLKQTKEVSKADIVKDIEKYSAKLR